MDYSLPADRDQMKEKMKMLAKFLKVKLMEVRITEEYSPSLTAAFQDLSQNISFWIRGGGYANEGRLEVLSDAPKLPGLHFRASKHIQIGFSDKKSAKIMAGDIQRRFLPTNKEVISDIQKQIANVRECHTTKVKIQAKIQKACSSDTVKFWEADIEALDYRAHRTGIVRDLGSITVSGYSADVKLDLAVSPELACKLLKVIEQYNIQKVAQ